MKNKQESLQIRIGLHRITIQSLKALYKAQAVGNAACAKNFIKHQENIFQQFRQNKNKRKICPILDTHMSGSPIIRDGKLVGAVTHVLVNDPTTGYGIFIENMLDTAA